jgi:Ca2+-transporting ATPase
MAGRQLRVLGLAYAEHDAGDDDRMPDLTWIGLVGLADPLRPGVAGVIERFHRAGIRTIMLTGDQAGTAYEIGKALRLGDGEALNIVNSDELDIAAPERLRELVAGAHVFSRVTPSDKLRIVQALQATGFTVAMTGDGINDAPALRAADIGIAMGSGTEVALSVADVALKSDQLDAVLAAIRQGRSIASNTRKAVHFLVSTNLSEILIVAGMVAFGKGQPVSPLQLLWMNLLTDMLPAIALAAEAPEDDLMQYPPHNPRGQLVGRHDLKRYSREGAVLAAGTLSAYGISALRHGVGARAATVGFDTLVLGQMLHALSCRSERHRMLDRSVRPNRQLGWAIAASLALQLGAHLFPGLRRLLGISPPGLLDLLAIAAGAGLPVLVNEWEKPTGQPAAQRIAATSASAERSTSFSTSVPTSLSAACAASAEPVPRA